MLFNSIEYIQLLLLSLTLYWVSPYLKLRQAVVFVASIYFYMTWSKIFAVLLLLLILVNWIISYQVQRSANRHWLVVALVLNLGLLAYFKYANFFLDNIEALAKLSGMSLSAAHINIVLPLGISFYVFELISYQVDLYRRKITHERNFLVFANFVLFFPHLIAGPICRATQFMPQMHTLQSLDVRKLFSGLYMFLAGFAIKCGIADGLAPYVNVIFATPNKYSGFDNLMSVLGFGVQILCDFWGYSLMALGAALMFGYVLPHNFNAPYAALSIRDFWRRWHMTLSNWLRDYLYIALGGSRSDAQWKIQRNLALTMLLGGLWHGASWNFIIWGGIHGFALAVNRWFDSVDASKHLNLIRVPALSWLLTMTTVFVAWIFFRASTLDQSLSMLFHITTFYEGWASSALSPVFFELLLMFLPLQWLIHKTTFEHEISDVSVLWQLSAVVLLTAFAMIYYVNGNDFIYFQF